MNIIILAGGLGTRLRSVIGPTPKPIALVHGKPFLYYILKNLEKYDIDQVCLSLGYGADDILAALHPYSFAYTLSFVKEPTALGTGGGILFAIQQMNFKDAVVLNGDTFFDIPLDDFWQDFLRANCDIQIAARLVADAERYGALELQNNRVTHFFEKTKTGKGVINGGIYALNAAIFDQTTQNCFSFETFLKENIETLHIQAQEYNHPFIDIGVPQDYKACGDFLNALMI